MKKNQLYCPRLRSTCSVFYGGILSLLILPIYGMYQTKQYVSKVLSQSNSYFTQTALVRGVTDLEMPLELKKRLPIL